MAGKRKLRVKIGDVYAIPLPNGRYGFGKVYNDGGFGVYEHIGNRPDDLPENEEFQFYVGVYRDLLTSGKWEMVDHRPFADEEQSYPPPQYIKDVLSGQYSIYHQGEIRKASKEECEGLEVTAVWDEHHIVDRMMGEDKWHR